MKFFAPALDEVGQKALIPFVLISEIFLFMGAFFAYFITIPIANRYLFNFNETLGTNLWTLSHYLDYTLLLLVGNALAFELTVIGFFLVHFQLMDYLFLKDKRRYMIVLAFILGAFLTPPDVITQILLAVPLIGLYELMVLYAKKIYLKDREYQNRIDASS